MHWLKDFCEQYLIFMLTLSAHNHLGPGTCSGGTGGQGILFNPVRIRKKKKHLYWEN